MANPIIPTQLRVTNTWDRYSYFTGDKFNPLPESIHILINLNGGESLYGYPCSPDKPRLVTSFVYAHAYDFLYGYMYPGEAWFHAMRVGPSCTRKQWKRFHHSYRTYLRDTRNHNSNDVI